MDDAATAVISPELSLIRSNKLDGYNYRERRQDQWTENYTLYRDTVLYNRLTQRQTVNVPLMKMSLRTLLSQYDDMPMISFEELSNDEEKEVFLNEYWRVTGEKNRFEIQDIVDKKQEEFFGRTFDQWQIIDGSIRQTIISPEDILLSRYCDPTNINTSRYLYHLHVFVPLAVLEQDEQYDKNALASLKAYYSSNEGLKQSEENRLSYIRKQQKMADIGLQDAFNPMIGETIVELTLCFQYEKSRDEKGQEIYLKVEAQDREIILNKALEEIIGETKDHWWQTHYPYNSWAGDVDNQDVWTDGVADIVRMSNKIANTYYSQMVENRTLKNLNMNYWDGTVEGAEAFVPQTFEPKPWGWYKLPGDPNKIVKQVQVADLDNSLEDLKFIMEINERATGATATQQGVQNGRQVTLGEIKLDLSQAQERVKGISKFYNQVWHDRAMTFLKLVEAAPDKLDAVQIYKKGKNTDKLYARQVAPPDWESELGYTVRVWSQAEKNELDTSSLEKWSAVKANMPDNPKVDNIYKRKLVDFAGAKPDEAAAIMEFEDKKQEMLAQQQASMLTQANAGQPGISGQQPPQPGLPAAQPAMQQAPPQGAPPMMA